MTCETVMILNVPEVLFWDLKRKKLESSLDREPMTFWF